MPSDHERFRFLDEFKLTANWDDEEFTLFWREKSVPWQYGRLYVISKGATLAQVTDEAIERWERKHGKPWLPIETPIAAAGTGRKG
jgi:hypothetical protein